MRSLLRLVVAGCLACLGLAEVGTFRLPSPWSYSCDNSNSSIGGHFLPGRCVKIPSADAATVQGLQACKMTCAPEGTLWPVPTGKVQLSKTLEHFIPQSLRVVSVSSPTEKVSTMINQFVDVFREYLYLSHPKYEGGYKNPFQETPYIKQKQVDISLEVESGDLALRGDTDESYTISISPAAQGHTRSKLPTQAQSQVKQQQENFIAESTGTLAVSISAPTYYGLRAGLETLSQMITYDDLSDSLQIYSEAAIEDRPSFPHRGLLLDTSRNFMSKKIIKEIISGMSYDKLNVFHWHITDTHSFPFYSRRVPQLTLLGAYSPHKVYTPEDIREIVDYAKLRGVRVLPEFDAPAHVGNGWQFGEAEGKGRLVVCENQEPWQDYCVEPPCGQLNPVNPEVYTTLAKLYQDFFELFETDMFHMGGDEVNLNCWNSSAEIRSHLSSKGHQGTKEELLGIWKDFQDQAAEKVYEAAGEKLPIILWTNSLTEEGQVERFLSNDDYVIQIWTTGTDTVIKELIDKDYKVIFSNYDAWYFDCGYSSWVGEGNNWCSPYKGWQVVYENSPRGMYRAQGGQPGQEANILGGEAAMWSEQVEGQAVIHKLWPRASALGERLWSDPPGGWKQAEVRMVNHRERLVSRGIAADALQPEWCHQNDGLCYVRV